jgi:hypothetical protein
MSERTGDIGETVMRERKQEGEEVGRHRTQEGEERKGKIREERQYVRTGNWQKRKGK